MLGVCPACDATAVPVRQGVPKRGADHALHSAQAEHGAGPAQLAERAAQLWHEPANRAPKPTAIAPIFGAVLQ